MATLRGWIKANVLITTIVAMAVSLIVAISYGSSWLGVLLLSIPFVALGIAVVTAVTSFFGLAALRLIQRCPDSRRPRRVCCSPVPLGSV